MLPSLGGQTCTGCAKDSQGVTWVGMHRGLLLLCLHCLACLLEQRELVCVWPTCAGKHTSSCSVGRP